MFIRISVIVVTALMGSAFFNAPFASTAWRRVHQPVFPDHFHIDSKPIEQAGVVEEVPGDASCDSAISVNVYDQSCADCAERLMDNFNHYAGFQRAGFDPYRNRITITMRPGATLDDERVRRILFDSGYVPYRVVRGCDNARVY